MSGPRSLRVWSKLALFIQIVLVSQSVAGGQSNDFDYLGKVNFVVGIARLGASSENATRCGRELAQFLHSVQSNELWSLKIIDSFGNVPKSFSWGNYFWFSSWELCNDLNAPYVISLSPGNPHVGYLNETSPFPVEFRMIYYNFTTPAYVDLKLQFEHTIHVGLCVPKSCDEHTIRKYANGYFGNHSFELQEKFAIEMREVDSKTPGFTWDFMLNSGMVLCIITLLLSFSFSTMAEVIYRLHRSDSDVRKTENPESGAGYTQIESFFLCFHMPSNLKILLKIEKSKSFLPVIAGLRTLVCLWVTLFHVYYYSLFTVRNIPLLFAKLENFILQPILQSCFYVDVFFVISAFLLVNNFLSNTHSIEAIKSNGFVANLKMILNLIMHRYIRLMPVLYVTMILSEIFFAFMDMYTPFKMDQFSGLYCRDTWWYNVLFINNFLDLKYICASWSWYLGCEMQYFIFFTILLFVYVKNERLGKTLFAVCALSFVVISGLCNYTHGITFQIDVIYSTLEHLYVKPWVRINPYFGGAFMGWLHYKTKSNGFSLSGPWKFLFWTSVTLVYLTTIFMSYWRSAPVWIVAIIMSLGKLIFGLFAGGVILVCQQRKTAFGSIMGSNIFLFLNKFCFSIYMLAPVIVAGMFGLRTESTHFSEVGSGADFISIIALSLAGSFILVLLFEIPFQKLSNKFVLKR